MKLGHSICCKCLLLFRKQILFESIRLVSDPVGCCWLGKEVKLNYETRAGGALMLDGWRELCIKRNTLRKFR